jgi:YD repeat-containing protein
MASHLRIPPADPPGGGNNGGGGNDPFSVDTNGAAGNGSPDTIGSGSLVDVGNGEFTLTEFDFGNQSIGGLPSSSRGYSNLNENTGSSGNNWWSSGLPVLVEETGYVTFTGLPRRRQYYAEIEPGAYETQWYAQSNLAKDAVAAEFTVTGASGARIVMHDFTAGAKAGRPKRYLLPNGDELTYHYDDLNRIDKFEREIEGTVNGYYYEFEGSDTKASAIVLKIREQAVRRVRYEYYGESDPNGLAGDLKFVIKDNYDQAAGVWLEMGRTYYRYYIADSSEAPKAFAGALKFRVSNEGCSRLRAAGLDVATADDDAIRPYSDFNLQYDPESRRVVSNLVRGKYLHQFEYLDGPAFDGDFSHWTLKTTQTLPDGNVLITFSANRMILSRIFKSGGDEWFSYYERDELGRVTLHADSSAISDVNETTGLASLKAAEGLIRTYSWHSRSYLDQESYKIGSGGGAVLVRQNTYEPQTVDFEPIFRSKDNTVYQASGGGGASTMSRTYVEVEDTYQVSERITVCPPIPEDQNGDDEPVERIDVFNAYGQLTWSKDERGFITARYYDPVTMAMIRRIDDVQTPSPGAPDGWSTPEGGGLNLVTDYDVDLLGRVIRKLGPLHEIDVNGRATLIRRAEWTVYLDSTHQTRTAMGYITGDDEAACVINPVRITRADGDGHVTDEIQAIRLGCDCDGNRAKPCMEAPIGTPGAPKAEERYDQSTWVRWRSNQFNDAGERESERLYFCIPDLGIGRPVFNYAETIFGYDSMGRQDYVKSPGGTITHSTFTPLGWLADTWVGTSEPSGVGSGNMKMVERRIYDGPLPVGAPGGVGELTFSMQYASATEVRTTEYQYDGNHRLTHVISPVGYTDVFELDLIGRRVGYERRATIGDALLARSETAFDDLGRVYQVSNFTGLTPAPADPVVELSWYDPAGNLEKHRPAGSLSFRKMKRDGLGRLIASYDACASEEEEDDPSSVDEDIVVAQSEIAYDPAGNVIVQISRQRFHDESDAELGELGDPQTQPKARVYYSHNYPDSVGRLIAIANLGTNGGIPPERAATVPMPSDTCLLSQTRHNARGEVRDSVDPNGTITRQTFDDAGRLVETIENFSVEGGAQ